MKSDTPSYHGYRFPPEPSVVHSTWESIRIGSKALAYWPYKFATDDDADDLLRLFEEVSEAGKNLAFMAHCTHPRELETYVAQEAVRRVRSTGAVIRCQAPIISHVNDDADVWARMWTEQVKLGAVPYYMFVERHKAFRIGPLQRGLACRPGRSRLRALVPSRNLARHPHQGRLYFHTLSA